MELRDVERLIARGESETAEFKQSTGELRQAMETLCAFLNGAGGTVVFGVAPGRKVIGQDVADRTLQDVATAIRKIEPAASFDIAQISLSGSSRQLLVLTALAAPGAIPFVYDGRPYQRIGTTTCLLPQERYQQLLLNRIHSRYRWETAPAEGVDIDALDQEAILRTVRAGIAAGRIPESTGDDLADALDRFGLRVGGQVINAAMVLFGTRFLPFYPQCQLRLARFRGVNKDEFLDSRQVTGHAFHLLDEAMQFMQRFVPVAGRIEPGLVERIDTPLFPLVALREAIVNALCHRDYATPGGGVDVAIYDDRLEVWSTGTLPFGLRVEDLKREHQSRPRNRLIADVFYRRGLVEQWGRGTQNIVELCVAAGHPEPVFVEQAGSVGVRFLPSGYVPPLRAGLDLTVRQRLILQVLANGQAMRLRDIRERLPNPPSDRYLVEDMTQLLRVKLVEAMGRTRGRVYRIRREGGVVETARGSE